MKQIKQKKFDSLTFLTLLFFVFIIIAGIVVYFQAQEAHYILRHAKWYYVAAGIGVAFVSYFFATLAYVLVASIFSLTIHKKEIFYIGFMTIPVGKLLDIGGIVGNSIRVAYLRNFGIKDAHAVVLSSFFYTYCIFLGILAFVPIGFVWLFLEGLLTPALESLAKLILEISLGAFFIATIIVFFPRIREKILDIFSQIIYFITRREIDHRLEPIHNALLLGTKGLQTKPVISFEIVASVLLSWTCAVIVLWLCFEAFGIQSQFGVLVVALSLGTLTGLFAPIPGGIGVQDTSMIGIFVLFGIPLHDAIFISVLFRVTYDIIPAGVGLIGYYFLIERLKKRKKIIENNNGPRF